MITTILHGGCANQMFQYAMGLATAERLNTELILDIGSFEHDRMREYSLGLFPNLKHRIVRGSNPTVHENGLPHNQAVVDSIKDGDVLKGYWQTEKYFTWTPSPGKRYWIDDQLEEMFQPGPLTPAQRQMLINIRSCPNSTFLTVRRTDYVHTPFHGLMTMEYYREALKVIERETGAPPSVFVFSDEPEWCLSNLDLGCDFDVAGTFDRTVKGHLGREDADLYLMSRCRNGIMANSSFSWWGAWLAEARHTSGPPCIVGPKKWFGAAPDDPRDIIPERWIKI